MAVSDWDFFLPTAVKTLDATIKVSTPTSLKIAYTSGAVHHVGCLSRLAAVQNVPQGQIVCWLRRGANPCGLGFIFRNQSALGAPDAVNMYYGMFNGSSTLFYRRVNSAETSVGGIIGGWTDYTWGRLRLTWWNGENLSGVSALCIRIERDDGVDIWTNLGTIYDTVNQWKDSSINRVGLDMFGGGTQYNYWDDTEIWTPTV